MPLASKTLTKFLVDESILTGLLKFTVKVLLTGTLFTVGNIFYSQTLALMLPFTIGLPIILLLKPNLFIL